MNKTKLRKLAEAFSPELGTKVDFAELDQHIAKLKEALTEKIQARTIDDVLKQLEKFKKKLDFKSLFETIANFEITVDGKTKQINEQLDNQMKRLSGLMSQNSESVKTDISEVAANIQALKNELSGLTEQKNTELKDLRMKVGKLEEFGKRADDIFQQIQDNIEQNGKEAEKELKTFNDKLEALRKEFNNRLSNLGGGNANRQITVNSSTSTLAKYTDVNLQASSSIGWRVTVDETNKWVSIAPSLISGGGSGSGITRSVSVITANTTGAEAAITDYVYVASAVGITFTLPTAISNTNLYTIKNFTGSSVLIATSAGQTIDQSATALIDTMNQSLSFISNNSVWGVV